VNVSGFRLQSEKWSFSEFVKRVYQNDGLVSIKNDMTFCEKFYPYSCDFVLDNRLSTGAGAHFARLRENYFLCSVAFIRHFRLFTGAETL